MTNKADQCASKDESSTIGALLFLLGQVPLLIMFVAFISPLAYSVNVFLPLIPLILAEVYYRPSNRSMQEDGANWRKSRTSLTLLIASYTIQAACLLGHVVDDKPFDVPKSTRLNYPTLHIWTVSTSGQIVGSLLWLLAVAQLKGRFTRHLEIVDNHALYKRGMYSIMRHPGYASAILFIGSGTLTYTRNMALTMGATILMYRMYYRRIQAEEDMLMQHFEQEYVEYRKVTGDLLPWINIVPTKQKEA